MFLYSKSKKTVCDPVKEKHKIYIRGRILVCTGEDTEVQLHMRTWQDTRALERQERILERK